MEDLVNKSLARRTVTSDDITGTWYSVHNLQLTFLQEQATNLEALHKKLVDRYRHVYNGKLNDAWFHASVQSSWLNSSFSKSKVTIITPWISS